MDDLDCCRTCGHFYGYHFDRGMTVRETCMAEGQCDPFIDHGCNCKEYIPEGNLDYLEWRYNKCMGKRNIVQ